MAGKSGPESYLKLSSVCLFLWLSEWHNGFCLSTYRSVSLRVSPSCSPYTNWQTGSSSSTACRGWLFRLYTLLSLLPCVSRVFVCRRRRQHGYGLPLRPIGTRSRCRTAGGQRSRRVTSRIQGQWVIHSSDQICNSRFWLDVRFGINFFYYSSCREGRGDER